MKCLQLPRCHSDKESICQCRRHKRCRFDSWGWKDPLEKGMATLSSIAAWKIPQTEELCELESMRLQRVRHDSTQELWAIWSACIALPNLLRVNPELALLIFFKNSPSGVWEILLKVSATLCLIQVLDRMRLHSQAEELRKTKLMEDKNSSIMSLILSFLCLLRLCDFNFLFFFASSPYHCLFKGTNITNSFPLMSKRLTDLSVFSTL